MPHYLSVIAVVALAVVAADNAGASHEKSRTFTSTVFPNGPTFSGGYIRGKCIATVDVEAQTVDLTYCTFSANR